MPKINRPPLISARYALIAGLIVAAAASAAEAQLVVYDDFSSARIDENKWHGRQIVNKDGGTGSLLEVQREITAAQALVLQNRVVGGNDIDSGAFSVDNALAFRRAQAINEVLFDLAVRKIDVAGCGMSGEAEAGGRGVFALFNDGHGDVVATIGVARSSASQAPANELDVMASLVLRTDEGEFPLGDVRLGSALLGQQVRLRMRWEPARSRVRFQRDADALVAIDYTNVVIGPPGAPRKYLAAASSVTDCAGPAARASVVATFDNIRVNP